jgi:AraC-like DNA-binding protein/quercetin dioxygenase-like cupin family protein
MKKYHISDYNLPPDCRLSAWKGMLKEPFPEHTHDFSELVIIFGGTAEQMVNGKPHFVKAGDVYVFNGNAAHSFANVHGLKLANISFTPDRLESTRYDLKTMSGYQALFVMAPASRSERNPVAPLHLGTAKLGEASALVDRMIAEAYKAGEGYRSLLTAYFIELVVLLSRSYPGDGHSASQGLTKIANMIAHLEEHFREEIRLSHLAGIAGVSTRQLIRLFKDNFQTTPMAYVLNLRLHHGCSMLAQTSRSITDIAYASGFNDSNYFTRQFKKLFKVSPRGYRMSRIKA